MSKKITLTGISFILLFFLTTSYQTAQAQVGINTTTPQSGSMLDVTSSDKGILIPRVNISNLSTIAPITGGSTESLLVYNTNTSTGKGFYYWDGSEWVTLGEGDDWKEGGNTGTNPSNDFVGTTDNVGLRFRTNNVERMEITNTGRIMAIESGTEANPLFAWSGDTNKGFYSPGADQFGLVTGGNERFRIPNTNQVHAMGNGTVSAPFYSWNSDVDSGLWRSLDDRINISAGGLEMVEFRELGTSSAVIFNDGRAETDFYVRTLGDANTFNIDGSTDDIGIGMAPTSGRLQVKQNDATTEASILTLNAQDNRTLSILQPDVSNNNDPFTYSTGNAHQFRVDAVDAMLIASDGDVAIGDTTLDASAQLQINGANQGVLINRVALTSTTVAAPVASPATGLLVFNTNPNGSGATEVSEGFYYWNGSRWVAMDGANGRDWSLTGNAGTTAGTHFIGTTDNVSFETFTNNTSRMRVEDDGQITMGFGAGAAPAGMQLGVNSGSNGTAIGAYNTSANSAMYAQNTATGGALYGYAANAAASIIADNNSTTGVGLIAAGANQGAGFYNGAGLSSNGNGLGITGAAYSLTGTGAAAYGNNGGTIITMINGGGLAGTGDTGVAGFSTSTTGTGVIGIGGGTLTAVVNPTGSGISGTGANLGVFGYAGDGDSDAANYGHAGGEFILDTDGDTTTNNTNDGTRARARLAGFDNVTPNGIIANQESYYGGYFAGGNENNGTPSYAYVGMRFSTNGNGNATTGGTGMDYKIIGTGNVSTLINDDNGTPHVMYAPEAPEVFFQDFGTGQLVNGITTIQLDKILQGNIHVDVENPLKVYVTLEGECNGIFVTNKSKAGFTVKELAGGKSNAAFSWQIVASRADTKNERGEIVSKHVGVRLPVGPGPIKSTHTKAETKISKQQEAKEEIQPRGETVQIQPAPRK